MASKPETNMADR